MWRDCGHAGPWRAGGVGGHSGAGFPVPSHTLWAAIRGGPAPAVTRPAVSAAGSCGGTWWPGLQYDHCCCPSPSRSLASPKHGEASLVPAETTKSPELEAFPKFLERLPAMSQCSLAAPLTGNQPGRTGSPRVWTGAGAGAHGQPWGHITPVCRGPTPSLARGVVVPRCVYSRTGREAAHRVPSSCSAPGPALLSWGSAWCDPEAFGHIFPCSAEDTRLG